jgi:uncharacterized protein (DUF1800 family)
MSSDTQPRAEFRPSGTVDIATALAPYRGPWSAKLAAHLLRRAGFGGSGQEIQSAAAAGMTAAVDRLVRFGPDTLPQAPQVDISYGKMVDKMQRRQAFIGTELWYLNRLLLTPNPLQEKMTYFWSNHFTSAMGQKGISPAMTIGQLALFRKYALGNYAALTHDVSRDPAMLHYLDGIQNRAQQPNENYARELMELFTLGVGNYTEEDVRQSARAFTGFSVNRRTGEFRFNPQMHDDGTKTFLGHTGNFDGDQIVDIIMQQPATGRFMARKFLRAFVYDDPEPALVDAVAGTFRSSGYDVGALMNTLLRSNVFYSDRAYRAIVKSPLEITIGALKTLGATTVGGRTLAALNTMGQVPLRPPNVAGWPGGALWMNQGVFLARLNYLHQLVMFKSPGTGGDPADTSAAADLPAMKGAGMKGMQGMLADPAGQLAEPSTWVAGASVNDPRSVAQHVLQTVVQGDATAEQQVNILDFLSSDGVGNHVALTGENFEEKVRGAMSLAMALPSYQLA